MGKHVFEYEILIEYILHIRQYFRETTGRVESRYKEFSNEQCLASLIHNIKYGLIESSRITCWQLATNIFRINLCLMS